MNISLSKKWVIAPIALVLLVILFWWMLPKHSYQQVATLPAQHYKTYTVTRKTLPVNYRVVGNLRATVQSTLSAQITAKVTQVLVHAGQKVSAGQTLIVLDARSLQAQVEQAKQQQLAAKAGAEQAQIVYQRMRQLIGKGYVSQNQLDQAKANYLQAQASDLQAQRAYQQAKIELSYAHITAPTSGVILDKYVNMGDQATVGKVLLSFRANSGLQFEANVPAAIYNKIHLKQKVKVVVPAINATVTGVVKEVSPSVDETTRSFLVKVLLPNLPQAYPGMFARLLVPVGQQQRIVIPKNLLIQRGQLQFVRVLTDKQPMLVNITSGHALGDDVEILSGLTAGDRIIVKGA